MNEVKKPKKSIAFYYMIVLVVLILFNALAVPWMMERQINKVDYNTFIQMTEEKMSDVWRSVNRIIRSLSQTKMRRISIKQRC